jgi:hypothetical protein
MKTRCWPDERPGWSSGTSAAFRRERLGHHPSFLRLRALGTSKAPESPPCAAAASRSLSRAAQTEDRSSCRSAVGSRGPLLVPRGATSPGAPRGYLVDAAHEEGVHVRGGYAAVEFVELLARERRARSCRRVRLRPWPQWRQRSSGQWRPRPAGRVVASRRWPSMRPASPTPRGPRR